MGEQGLDFGIDERELHTIIDKIEMPEVIVTMSKVCRDSCVSGLHTERLFISLLILDGNLCAILILCIRQVLPDDVLEQVGGGKIQNTPRSHRHAFTEMEGETAGDGGPGA